MHIEMYIVKDIKNQYEDFTKNLAIDQLYDL